MERNIDKPLSQQTKERGTYAHKVVAVELAEQFAKLFDQLSLHPCKTTQHDKYASQPRFPLSTTANNMETNMKTTL